MNSLVFIGGFGHTGTRLVVELLKTFGYTVDFKNVKMTKMYDFMGFTPIPPIIWTRMK
jgi:hypothetical protein